MFIIQQALCQGLQTLPRPKQQLCSSVAVIVAADVVVAVVVVNDDDKDFKYLNFSAAQKH